MRRIGASLACSVAVAVAAVLLATPDGAAQSYRQFTGRIETVDAARVTVENRKGDRLAFDRTPETEVIGQGKGAWGDLAPGDRVAVSWLMMDEPRKAYRVVVMPPSDAD